MSDYSNHCTKTIKLNSCKSDMVLASENSENLAIDFPHHFGFISLRHADLFNLMRQLPDNSFKLYLYFFSQQEGTKWFVHRSRICKDTGLSEQEYRTAMAKLVELGIIDFEDSTFNGIKPLTKSEIFNEIDSEENEEEYSPEVDPELKEKLDKHQESIAATQTEDDWCGKAKKMDVVKEDKTFSSKKEALEHRAELLADMSDWE